MQPRVRDISLRNGVQMSTPLLIPSLSSRATGTIAFQSSSKIVSIEAPCSIIHSQALISRIEGPLLISAHDIHHHLLEDSEFFTTGFRQSRYAQPGLLFIDSGWYEKGNHSRDKQFGENNAEALPWEESHYQRTIDNLDDDVKPIVVSWDNLGSYAEQIAAAQDFFDRRSSLASTMLLKPPMNASVHNFQKLSGEDFTNLKAFDVVGVTEREIGATVLDRLVNISLLRRHLDEAHVESPIHVFGGLDPLHTPLYFAAGAELFDGLGWLRYAYRDGIAMHRDSAAILDRQITKPTLSARMSVCMQNLDELRRLEDDMRLFAHKNNDWTQLLHGDRLEHIFSALEARLGE